MKCFHVLANFLASTPEPLAELTSRYGIVVSPAADSGLVTLNYHQILSPMDEEIVWACRGTIVDPATNTIAARSFAKFFNWEEGQGQIVSRRFHWDSVRVLEKLDGTLITIYHYKGAWHIATRGRADASGPVGRAYDAATFETGANDFAALTKSALAEMGLDWESFVSCLNPARSYSFELTAPENRVLVVYSQRKLTWIGCFDTNTLEELPLEEEGVGGVPAVSGTRIYSNIEEFKAHLGTLNGFESEGYVLVDRNFERVKAKAPHYVASARAMGGLASERNRLEMVLAGSMDDVAGHVPEALLGELNRLKDAVQKLCDVTLQDYEKIKDAQSQKEFAMGAASGLWPAALFAIRKGEALSDCLRKTQADKILQLLGRM